MSHVVPPDAWCGGEGICAKRKTSVPGRMVQETVGEQGHHGVWPLLEARQRLCPECSMLPGVGDTGRVLMGTGTRALRGKEPEGNLQTQEPEALDICPEALTLAQPLRICSQRQEGRRRRGSQGGKGVF